MCFSPHTAQLTFLILGVSLTNGEDPYSISVNAVHQKNTFQLCSLLIYEMQSLELQLAGVGK